MEGIFLLKTVCIKTNNKKISDYLLKELEYFEMENTYISCYKFKHYINVIVNYSGKNQEQFLSRISTLLAYLIIDIYEPKIIANLINSNYFYFSKEEKKQIYNLCLTNVDFSTSIKIVNIISKEFFKHFAENKYVILEGFVSFKLKEYIKQLDSIVDMCVNKFVIDREYNEFISILKSYIMSSPPNTKLVHLIYKEHTAILLDSSNKVIKYNENIIPQKYLSDITFSANDFALNSLLTILPEKLYIHIIDEEDDFISTLKSIFDSKCYICKDCDICNVYRTKKVHISKKM